MTAIYVIKDAAGNEVSRIVADAAFVEAVHPGRYEWIEDVVPPVTEPTSPIETPPKLLACALRIPIVDGEVQAIGGAYRIPALMLMDTGTFLAVFSENLGEAEPFLIPNNGIHVSISEWGGDYAMLEVRDHAGGSLLTPASFGFSLYSF